MTPSSTQLPHQKPRGQIVHSVPTTHSHQVLLTSLPHLFSTCAVASAPSPRPWPQPPVCGINSSSLILKGTSDSIPSSFRILQCLPMFLRVKSKPLHCGLCTTRCVLAPAYLSSLSFQHLHPLQTSDSTVLNELPAVSGICRPLSHLWTFAHAAPCLFSWLTSIQISGL